MKYRKFGFLLADSKKTKPQIKKCTGIKPVQHGPKHIKNPKKYFFFIIIVLLLYDFASPLETWLPLIQGHHLL